MFEHSLIDLEPKKQSRRRWLSLPVAVALHLVGLAAFVFASYWNVGEVRAEQFASIEPYVVVTFPDLGGGGGGRPTPPKEPERQRQETAPPQQQTVQPELNDMPEQPPTPTTEAPLDDLLPVGPSDGPILSGGPGTDNGPGTGDGSGGPGDGPGIIKGPGSGDGDGDANQPIHFRTGGMTRPETVFTVQPRYTESARKVGIQGAVVVEAIIDEQGHVTNVRVLKGLPLGLDQAAVEAIRQWRFKPATLESTGKAVKVYYVLTVNFTIQR